MIILINDLLQKLREVKNKNLITTINLVTNCFSQIASENPPHILQKHEFPSNRE